jgi:Domain of unknown function (DUF4124)
MTQSAIEPLDMHSRWSLQWLSTGAASLALIVCAFVVSSNAFAQAYKWVDDKGVVHYGDTLPPEATKKQSTVINSQGRPVKKTDAALTPEQIAAKEAERERKVEQDKKVAERMRIDNMLTATYTKEQDFKAAYDRSANSLNARLLSLSDRLKGLEARDVKVNEEMEFYKAGQKKGSKTAKQVEVPPQLIADKERIDKERTSVVRETASTQKELTDLKMRIDSEQARWVALKSGLPAGSLENEVKKPDASKDQTKDQSKDSSKVSEKSDGKAKR